MVPLAGSINRKELEEESRLKTGYIDADFALYFFDHYMNSTPSARSHYESFISSCGSRKFPDERSRRISFVLNNMHESGLLSSEPCSGLFGYL
jgi:hypothetical protein